MKNNNSASQNPSRAFHKPKYGLSPVQTAKRSVEQSGINLAEAVLTPFALKLLDCLYEIPPDFQKDLVRWPLLPEELRNTTMLEF